MKQGLFNFFSTNGTLIKRSINWPAKISRSPKSRDHEDPFLSP